MKIFSATTSAKRFLIPLTINKIAKKRFSKNLSFGIGFKLQVTPLIYKMHQCCEKLSYRQDYNDQLCMQIFYKIGVNKGLRNLRKRTMHQISGCQLTNRRGLVDEKPEFKSQARHQNEIRIVFLRRFPLSRFLAKTLRVNKNCHEKFLKKSVVRSRL